MGKVSCKHERRQPEWHLLVSFTSIQTFLYSSWHEDKTVRKVRSLSSPRYGISTHVFHEPQLSPLIGGREEISLKNWDKRAEEMTQRLRAPVALQRS